MRLCFQSSLIYGIGKDKYVAYDSHIYRKIKYITWIPAKVT